MKHVGWWWWWRWARDQRPAVRILPASRQTASRQINNTGTGKQSARGGKLQRESEKGSASRHQHCALQQFENFLKGFFWRQYFDVSQMSCSNLLFMRENKMLGMSCCGDKYTFGVSTFESTDVEAFPEQPDRLMRSCCQEGFAFVGLPPPPRWLVPVRRGEGGRGERESSIRQLPHC